MIKNKRNLTGGNIKLFCLVFIIIISISLSVVAAYSKGAENSTYVEKLKNNLIEAVHDSDTEITWRETCMTIDSLIEKKVDVVNLLVQECQEKSVQRNSMIFKALSYIGTEQAKMALLEIALDTQFTNSYSLGDGAANAYIQLAKDSTEIAQLFNSKQPRVIDASLVGIAGIPLTEQAIESLGKMLDSKSSWRQHRIAAAFTQDKSTENTKRKTELLISSMVNLDSLEDKEQVDPEMGLTGYEFAYGSYLSALEQMPGSDNILLERINSANEQQQKMIIIALGGRREPAIREQLLQIIKTEKDDFIRWKAVGALYYIAADKDIPLLKELAAKDPYVRRHTEHYISHRLADQSPNYYPIREEAKAIFEWLPTRPPQNNDELADYKLLAKIEKLDLRKSRITNAGLAYLEKSTNLKELWLDGCVITDAGLAHIKALKNLESLRLNNTKITDTGLVQLTGLSKLTNLGLDYTEVSDVGLNHIADMSNLTDLGLEYTQISDAGLANIKKLKNLKSLRLGSPFLTDKGLFELRGLANLERLILSGRNVNDKWLDQLRYPLNLKWLGLGGTRVADEGVNELKHVMPDLTIQRY